MDSELILEQNMGPPEDDDRVNDGTEGLVLSRLCFYQKVGSYLINSRQNLRLASINTCLSTIRNTCIYIRAYHSLYAWTVCMGRQYPTSSQDLARRSTNFNSLRPVTRKWKDDVQSIMPLYALQVSLPCLPFAIFRASYTLHMIIYIYIMELMELYAMGRISGCLLALNRL